jgi:RNA polymerase sigma-70 factor (ECF subfamily)
MSLDSKDGPEVALNRALAIDGAPHVIGASVRPVLGDDCDSISEPVACQDAAAVIREHASFVWRVLRYLRVADNQLEDLSQEVFIVVLRQISQFQGRSALRTWLYGICWRVAAAARRQNRARREVLTGEPNDRRVEPDQDHAVWFKESYAQLLKALSALDEPHRMVFVLYEIEDFTMEEISQALGAPLTTCYSRLYASREKVRAWIRRSDSADHREKQWR